MEKKIFGISVIIIFILIIATSLFFSIYEKPVEADPYYHCKAIVKRDVSLCSKITDIEEQETCNTTLLMIEAKEKNSRELCNKISNETFLTFSCVMAIEKDISLCKKAPPPLDFMCEIYIPLLFDEITLEEAETLTKNISIELNLTQGTSNYYFDKAWIRNKPELCEELPPVLNILDWDNENYKNIIICRALFGIDTCDEIRPLVE